jgi:hypothetical protein
MLLPLFAWPSLIAVRPKSSLTSAPEPDCMTGCTASRATGSKGTYAGWLDAESWTPAARTRGASPWVRSRRRGAQFWRGTGVGCMRKPKA